MKNLLLASLLALLAGCTTQITPEKAANQRKAVVHGAFGTYNAPPRLTNGRVDQARLLSELRDINANTYHWLIWHNTHDWDDLQTFLPLARRANIKVWVTVVPPSESPPHTKAYSEPFRTNYVRWVEEFAKLSLREKNLVAWSVDDFTHNLKIFTPDYLRKVVDAGRAINPKFAFVPCCYFKQTTSKFAEDYGPLLDGVLFPYRAESAGGNLTDSTLVGSEVQTLRQRFGPKMPIILDVYATRHSRLGPSTPEYVREVIVAGQQTCDGVLIYCHQDPKRSADKYQAIKECFASPGEKARR